MWKGISWECIGEVIGKDQGSKSTYEGDPIFDAGD